MDEVVAYLHVEGTHGIREIVGVDEIRALVKVDPGGTTASTCSANSQFT